MVESFPFPNFRKCAHHTSFANSSKDAVRVFCEMVRHNLGVSESVRCIAAGDGENEVFVKDTVETLKLLDLEHPAAVHVVSTCQAHKDVYGVGGKSLLFFIGQLTSQLHKLLNQGIPLPYLEELLHEGVEYCIDHLQQVTVPVYMCDHTILSQKACSLVTSPHLQGFQTSCAINDRAAKSESPPLSVKGVGQVIGSGQCSVGAKLSGVGAGGGVSHAMLNNHDDRTGTETCKPSCAQSSHKSYIVHKSANVASSVALSSLNSFLRDHTKPASSSAANLHKNVMLRSRHLKCDGPVNGQTECSLSESNDGAQSSSVTTLRGAQSPVTKLDGDDCWRTGDSSGGPDMSACTAGSVQHLSSSHVNFNQSALYLPATKNGLKCDCRIAPEKPSISLPRDAQYLSHGCPEMMSWAEQTVTHQLLQGKDLRFDADLIHTVCVGGGSGRHELVEGLVISASQEMTEVMSRSRGPTSLLLINGDVTSRFRHIGFRDTLRSTRLTGTAQSLQHRNHDTWLSRVLTLLTQLSVGVVLARGSVDADLSASCLSAGIAVVDRMPFQALKLLQVACRAQLLTYILHAQQENLCQGVAFKSLREDWCDTMDPGRKHLVITTPVLVQTMVVSAPSAVGREMQEEEFSHCLARLRQAAQDGKVLAGGAATEAWCANLLTSAHHSHTDTASQSGRWAGEVALYRPVVRAALAEAFLSFSHTVQRNRERAGHSHSVQTVCTVQHSHFSPVKACDPCHHTSQHAPSLQPSQSVLAESCQKCTGASTPVFVHESLMRNEASHSIPFSENRGCRNELDMLAGHSTSQLLTLGATSADSDLRPTLCSGNSGQSSHVCDISSCAPSGRATEEGLYNLAALHQSEPEASTTVHGCSGAAVWDNYSSKVNGWRSAVQCACAVMRMDEAIVTGLDQNSVPPQAVLL